MIDFDDIKRMAHNELIKLQQSGYLTPENEDLEVGMAIESASYNIASNIFDATDNQYILVDGKFYSKKAVLALKEEKI